MSRRPSQKGRAICRLAAAALVFPFVASCTGPTEPSGSGPVISCPAAQSAASPTGASVQVDYPKPTFTGGIAPVAVTCRPEALTLFPPGTTSVTCSAVDKEQRTSSCSFTITVTRAPQISATRFLAFGDSITSGKSGESCPPGGGISCTISTTRYNLTAWLANREGWFANLEESTAAYPRVLRNLLAARYIAQAASIVIPNEGVAGETVAAGTIRLRGLLAVSAPEVLLLQEGANDMTGGNPPLDAIVENFRSMIRDARARNIRVFLGTVLPERPGACRAGDFCDGINHTVLLNARLRTLAAAEGATLVDLYAAFDGQTNSLLSLDGLHPNEAGYSRMADTFYTAIRQQLDVP